MMRTIVRSVLSGSVIGLALTALACNSRPENPSQPARMSRSVAAKTASRGAAQPSPFWTSGETSGEVVSTNPTQKRLVLMSVAGDKLTFEVRDSASEDLDKFEPGDRVIVKYTEVGGRYTAEAIRRG